MAHEIELVYCAAGNRRFAEIAINSGFLYGSQMPRTVYFPPWFCDQNWKKPHRQNYMNALAKHKPYMASVLDLEHEAQLNEVLGWAEDAAQYVEIVMIIPKVFGIIERIPRAIAGKSIRLGYSVPTRFGGTELPLWEFTGWPVHLLGGQPQIQIKLAHYMDVRSVDGNYAQKMAIEYGQFWSNRGIRGSANRYWPKLSDAGIQIDKDVPYVAFERSCRNIINAWRNYA